MLDTSRDPAADPSAQDTPGSIATVCATILELPPSCVEFSPKWPQCFVIGTYHLEDNDRALDGGNESGGQHAEGHDASCGNKPPLRDGSLILCQLRDNAITRLHSLTHPSAVLDLHFSPRAPDVFAVASSSGSVSLFELQGTPSYALKHLHTYQNFPLSTLVLSLAWHPSDPDLIGVSLSTGAIALLKFSHDRSTLTSIWEDINPHDGLEAWSLAFTQSHHPERGDVAQSIYSGGDDSRLRCTVFTSLAELSFRDFAKQPPGGFVGMTGHNAGVTAILPLPFHTDAGQDILLTGSYDDRVRVYAVRDHRPEHSDTPKVLAELRIGGGVWRLKFLRDYSHGSQNRRLESPAGRDPVCTFRVLASCMHAGARVLQVAGRKDGDWTIKELAAFKQHASMNYASDVQPAPLEADARGNDREALCVSTSFYDKLICIWRFKCN